MTDKPPVVLPVRGQNDEQKPNDKAPHVIVPGAVAKKTDSTQTKTENEKTNSAPVTAVAAGA